MATKQPPLLTHEQLVDWLIYHCPIEESNNDDRPFGIYYQGYNYMGDDPLILYHRFAQTIIEVGGRMHRRITDLYWYWTI